MNPRLLRVLLVFCAAYDGVLGGAFLLAAPQLFEAFEVTPPNHLGYVQFPAAMLLILGLGFAWAARAPRKHLDWVVAAVLLKIAYCGVAGFHWLDAGIPWIWKPFVVIDAITAVLLAGALLLGRRTG